jgi:uncharacterized membrane protein
MERPPVDRPDDAAEALGFDRLRPSTENDRLGYVFWIVVPLIVLLTDLRRSSFAYVHALQGLVFGGASIVFLLLYSCLTFALTAIVPPLGCVLWIGFLLPLGLGLYVAYRVVTASQVAFPVLSDVTRSLFRQQLAGLGI